MAKKQPKGPNSSHAKPREQEPVTEPAVMEEPLQTGEESPAPESSVDEAAPVHPEDSVSADTPEMPFDPLSSVELESDPGPEAAPLEQPVQEDEEHPAPDMDGEAPPLPDAEIIVFADTIDTLLAEKQASAEVFHQSPAPPEPGAEPAAVSSDTPAQGTPPEDRLKDWAKDEAQPKAPKAERSKQADAPLHEAENGKESKLSPAQKAAETRKARTGVVIDFLEGKRTSPFADGKPIGPEAADAPPAQPPEPKEAPRRGEQEQIVYLNLSELHPFKNHPFQVRNDEEMRAMVESVKDKGVTQPAIVRLREDGGYEIVSGHRRHKASELVGFADMPCIIRNLTDEQAITQMVEDNTNQRENILPSERAKALKMQLEAIKRQGARDGNGQRSNEIVAERNKMTVKQVQRYIKLNDLVPDLMKMVDDKRVSFTPAVELAFIKPRNQRYIAIAIEGQQSSPSLSQSQRMRELDQKGSLNGDVIDGIMLEEKKEVDKVIISSQELGQYFGKDKTPREMKDTIIQLLDEWKAQQPELAAPEKQAEQEK